MIQCDWCPKKFEAEEAVVLNISMPNYKEPYIHIRNTLCPDCSLEARKALAAVEISRRQ